MHFLLVHSSHFKLTLSFENLHLTVWLWTLIVPIYPVYVTQHLLKFDIVIRITCKLWCSLWATAWSMTMHLRMLIKKITIFYSWHNCFTTQLYFQVNFLYSTRTSSGYRILVVVAQMISSWCNNVLTGILSFEHGINYGKFPESSFWTWHTLWLIIFWSWHILVNHHF